MWDQTNNTCHPDVRAWTGPEVEIRPGERGASTLPAQYSFQRMVIIIRDKSDAPKQGGLCREEVDSHPLYHKGKEMSRGH